MSIDKSQEKHCDYNDYKRTRYFHGMLMTDRDFREEQIYHNEKRKLLNKMLHGTGVVCGLEITPTDCESSKIIIKPGLALDCAGNEIYVCNPYELDCSQIIDPCSTLKKRLTTAEDCAEIEERQKQENKWYLVIKYQEVPTDPVPVYTPGGGCEEKVCEYSRTREGYCFEFQERVPCYPESLRKNGGKCEEHKETNCSEEEDCSKKEKIRQFLCEELLNPYPTSCCEDTGVVLGSIDFGEGKITASPIIENDMINNWDCREYVITFGLLQHWMKLLAPTKLPFDAIVNYALLGKACQTIDSAVKMFEKICEEEKTCQSGEVISPKWKKKVLGFMSEFSTGMPIEALSEMLKVEPNKLKPVLAQLKEEKKVKESEGKYFSI